MFWVFRVEIEVFTCFRRFCNRQHESLCHSLMKETLNRSDWRSRKDTCLSNLLPSSIDIRRRGSDKSVSLISFDGLRRSRGARGELETGKHRYDPRKDSLVDFGWAARKSLVLCPISQRHAVSSWFVFRNSIIAWSYKNNCSRESSARSHRPEDVFEEQAR